MRPDFFTRFWSKVDESGDCWNWLGGKVAMGYGYFYLRHPKRSILAHRLSWFMVRGDIPDGLNVCHHCDNPGCVNPGHLFLGTDFDNQQDRVSKGHGLGEHHGMAKLSNQDVAEMRRLSANGVRGQDIARQYGITYQTVWRTVTRRNWRHIT